jgi:hypothetical protein
MVKWKFDGDGKFEEEVEIEGGLYGRQKGEVGCFVRIAGGSCITDNVYDTGNAYITAKNQIVSRDWIGDNDQVMDSS